MINPQRFSLQKSAIFLALPLLWLGGVSLADKYQSGGPLFFEYEFIPVAIHASQSADYGSDPVTAGLAPVNAGIIIDALKDQSISDETAVEITKGLDAETDAGNDIHTDDDQGQDTQVTTPDPTAEPTATPDSGNSGNGNGNGNANGQGNGNGGVVGDVVDDVEDTVDDLLGNGNGQGNGNTNDDGNANGQDNGNGNGSSGSGNPIQDLKDKVDKIIKDLIGG